MKDLGYTPETKSAEPMMTEKPPKPVYPSLTISDKALELFLDGEKMPTVGDEFEMTVKLKVCGISDNEWGRRLEMNVIESDTLAELDVDEESEEDEGMEEMPRSKRYAKEI